MAFGEPLDWTLRRQQEAPQYFSTLEDFDPDENMDIDMFMFNNGNMPSTFSQSAMNLAGHAARERMPQQQQPQERGFFGKLFDIVGEIDKPISTRLGFKAEGQGAVSSLENIAMEEATRPSNIALAALGLFTGGISTGAAGARIAASAAARTAGRNIAMSIGGRVAGNIAEQGLEAAGVENPYIRGGVGLGAGIFGGSLAGGIASGTTSWMRIAKMGMMESDDAIRAATQAELAAQEAARQSRLGGFGQFAATDAMAERIAQGQAARSAAAQNAIVPPPPPGASGAAAQAAQQAASQTWSTASWGEKLNALLSVPMFLRSNFDLSAAGRQLAPVFYSHPTFFDDAMKAQAKALGSEAGYLAHQAKITSDPRYAIHKLMGVEYGDLVKNREQQLASELTSKLFGWVPGSHAFERAYTASINETRYNLANKLLDEFVGGNSPGGIDDLKRIGSLVNAATGRGSLPSFMNENKFLGQQIFWAPRLLAGRLKVPYEAIFGNGVSQREAARQMLSFVSVNTALLSAAKATGVADVELDPRSSDFGQFVIGDRRYDPWAGYRPIANLAARLSANAVSSAGQAMGYDVDIPAMKGISTEEGEAGTYTASSLDIVNKFLRTKMAPLPAEIVTQLTGKDVTGERVDSPTYGRWQHMAMSLLAPLYFEQLGKEAFYKYSQGDYKGIATGAIASVPYGFGVSGDYYVPRPAELAAMGKYNELKGEDKLDAMRSMAWQQVKGYAGSNAKSYASWAEAAKKEYMDYYQKNGFDKVLADKYAQSMVDRSPISKIFDRQIKQFENEWMRENPALARRILTNDLNQPFNKRRLSITKKQAQMLSAMPTEEE